MDAKAGNARRVSGSRLGQVSGTALLAFLERHAGIIALSAVLIASTRIVTTYSVFNHTADEPRHFACGMYYFGGHMSPLEYAPFSRAMLAVGPTLAGARRHDIAPIDDSMPRAGLDILYDNYGLFLTLARLGTLPFFWLACWVIFIWGRRYFGRPTAAVAVLLFTLLPPVLAHAGLATTDMALASCLGAAFLFGLVWAEAPTFRNSLIFGALSGLAALSKFSALGFLPAALGVTALAYLVTEHAGIRQLARVARERAAPFCVALLSGALVMWAGYQFSIGRIASVPFPVPAPQFFAAIRFITGTNQKGLPAYLLGEYSDAGWWYYYPVALGVKTPVAFLLLLAFGAVLCFRKARQPKFLVPLAFAFGILAVGSLSKVNIGVRHVLPVYIGFSLVAAIGAVALLERAQTSAWAGWFLLVLLSWLVWTGAVKHPDYLAYFNELAGQEPENILVDSDLDWGQDLKRLARRLHQLGVNQVTFNSFIPADLEQQHGFPPIQPINPTVQSRGWTAVSPTWWKLTRFDLSLAYGGAPFWLDNAKPAERVGTMSLYYRP